MSLRVSDDGKTALWVGAVDDVWRLGKPRGFGIGTDRVKKSAGGKMLQRPRKRQKEQHRHGHDHDLTVCLAQAEPLHAIRQIHPNALAHPLQTFA